MKNKLNKALESATESRALYALLVIYALHARRKISSTFLTATNWLYFLELHIFPPLAFYSTYLVTSKYFPAHPIKIFAVLSTAFMFATLSLFLLRPRKWKKTAHWIRSIWKMKKSNRKILNYSIAVIVSFCCICLVLALAAAFSGSILSTPTPASRLPGIDLSTVIAQTYSAAQIQTQALFTPTPLLSPTPLLTPTFTPTVTMLPTATLSEFEMQTAQAWATYYANPTPTIEPFIYPTDEGIIKEPPSGTIICPCSSDTLNCGNFPTQNSAQACMDYCKSQGAGDIHNLDGDANGLACESLP